MDNNIIMDQQPKTQTSPNEIQSKEFYLKLIKQLQEQIQEQNEIITDLRRNYFILKHSSRPQENP